MCCVAEVLRGTFFLQTSPVCRKTSAILVESDAICQGCFPRQVTSFGEGLHSEAFSGVHQMRCKSIAFYIMFALDHRLDISDEILHRPLISKSDHHKVESTTPVCYQCVILFLSCASIMPILELAVSVQGAVRRCDT